MNKNKKGMTKTEQMFHEFLHFKVAPVLFDFEDMVPYFDTVDKKKPISKKVSDKTTKRVVKRSAVKKRKNDIDKEIDDFIDSLFD